MTKIAIFDYGAGNIFSLKNALEKQNAIVEVQTKVDNLKILDVKFNKELEERYPELGNKRVAFGLNQELANVISYIGRFNLVEADRDIQLSMLNDLKANDAKIEKTKYTAYVTIYDFAVNLLRVLLLPLKDTN